MKYIVVKERGCEVAILFDELLDHADVARGLDVVSAGFCQVAGTEDRWGGTNQSTYCHGQSITLGLEARVMEDELAVYRAVKSWL